MATLINMLYMFAPGLAALYMILGVMIKDSGVEWPARNTLFNKRHKKFYRLLALWSAAFVGLFTLLIAVIRRVGLSSHFWNLLGILIFFIVLQIMRFLAERTEEVGQGKAPLSKAIFDFIKDTLAFWIAYISIYGGNIALELAGIVIAGAIILAVIKYRIYDDIFKYNLYSEDNRRYVGKHPGHFLVHSFVDHLPRAYLYVAFSFTILDLSLIQIAPARMQPIFKMTSVITSITPEHFIDFVYFNVVTMATVGYGDITPVSPVAKLMCAFEILFTIILMTSIITLILNRFQRMASSKNS
jgi:hypothetical protein